MKNRGPKKSCKNKNITCKSNHLFVVKNQLRFCKIKQKKKKGKYANK